MKLKQPLRQKIAAKVQSILDIAFQPITSRLTDEEYFACRTRGDCVRALLRRAD